MPGRPHVSDDGAELDNLVQCDPSPVQMTEFAHVVVIMQHRDRETAAITDGV